MRGEASTMRRSVPLVRAGLPLLTPSLLQRGQGTLLGMTPPPPPPRDATPPTSEEYDDLKMRVPEIHTNHVIINYNKIDPKSIMTLCEIPCYNKSKERGTDEWFWTFFQQDWYDIVLFMKNKLNVPHAMGSL
jgi:hypothetical protein